MIHCADLFCGAGGTSLGLLEAARERGQRLKLTAVNHWTRAIETHSANHPEARHFCASLDALNPRELFREEELDILWASPECTHHSIARGGRPVNDQSRATAWCVARWAEALRPRVILVENVKEFMSWGPIGANGQPLARKKGDLFRAWLKALEAMGYRVEWRVLCAADYGDPTTRRRLFIYAVRGRRRIEWPEPTHGTGAEEGLFGQLKPWRAVREIIDWSDQGTSIYARRRPLAEKTMRRILKGLEEFGLAPFIVPQHRGGKPVRSTEHPLPTVTTTSTGVGLAQPFIMAIDHQTSDGGQINGIDDPLSTITTKQRHALAQPFLIQLRGWSNTADLGAPIPTITAGGGHFGLVQPLIVPNFGERNGQEPRVHSISEPLPTVTSHGAGALVSPYLVKFYGSATAQSADKPLGTVTTKDRFGLCQPVIEIDGERYLVDILFRMLKPGELAAAQGFPKEYRFLGNTTEIVRQIGNAVPPGLARALGRSALAALGR